MTSEIVAIRTFLSEIDAEMALQLFEGSGISAFILKDDAGGMEPHLQLTAGVRLFVNRGNANEAQEILLAMEGGS